MMNICHVITRLIIGGAQENTVLTCRGLVEKGHRVTLISGPETGAEGSLWSAAEKSGAQLIRSPHLFRAVRPAHDYRAARSLTSIFRELKPDVVHTHSSKAGIVARYAAHRAKVPVVVHTVHGMSFNRTQSWLTRLVYRVLESLAAKWTDGFVSVADSMTRQSVSAGIAEEKRFRTVRSGLETENFAPELSVKRNLRADWGLAESDVVAGTIARLFENKGYDEIIAAMPEAVRREPRLKFVWIGDGPHRARYLQRVHEMGLQDRVRLLGLITPQEVAQAIRGFDMLVHASRWEGLPRAVVQALLSQVPAISFDNDGAPEVVIHNETGLLVPYGDEKGLGDAMVRLAGDEGLRKRLGESGRSRCLAEFDWRRMVEKLDEYYRELLLVHAAREDSGN